MSRHSLERALHQLCVDRGAKQRFREDPAAFLDRFQLGEAERAMVLAFDVKGLQDQGVNPMLTMGFWQELSPDRSMKTYMAKLGGAKAGESGFSAALKG